MAHRHRGALLVAALGAGGVLLVTAALALAPHVVDWYAVVAGGGPASSVGYTLSGSVGQTAVEVVQSDRHQLALGFWPGTLATARLPTPGPPSRTPTATGTAPTATASAIASATETRTPRLTVTPTRTRPFGRTPTPTATSTAGTATPEATARTATATSEATAEAQTRLYLPHVVRDHAVW